MNLDATIYLSKNYRVTNISFQNCIRMYLIQADLYKYIGFTFGHRGGTYLELHLESIYQARETTVQNAKTLRYIRILVDL